MSGLGLIISFVSLCVAVIALWKIWLLRQEISDLKRDRYYWEQKVKSIPSQLEAAVEPLRIQLALMVLGKPVSDQLIRRGRLYHEITAKEAEKFFDLDSRAQQILWLDVRTSAEFSKQHIPGAQLIPVEDLETRCQTELSVMADKIMVYCASGDRSRLACDFLSRHEFGNVYHIKDGLQGWSGPMEGSEAGGLIQIASKSKSSGQMDTRISSSVSSS